MQALKNVWISVTNRILQSREVDPSTKIKQGSHAEPSWAASSRYSPGEFIDHVVHRFTQYFIMRWKRGGLIHGSSLSLTALIFFLTAVFAFQKPKQSKLETYGEVEQTRNDLPHSRFQAKKEHLFFKCLLNLFIESVCLQCVMEVRRKRSSSASAGQMALFLAT